MTLTKIKRGELRADLTGGMKAQDAAKKYGVDISTVHYHRKVLRESKAKPTRGKAVIALPRVEPKAADKLVALIGSPESIREYMRNL